jgi:hypothetical protein
MRPVITLLREFPGNESASSVHRVGAFVLKLGVPVYVAISRCRTLEGLSLRVPLQMRDIIVDSSAEAFFAEAAGERKI